MSNYVDVKEGYDYWAPTYPWDWVESFEKERVLRLIGEVKGKKILDLGCGTGRNITKLASEGTYVTGVDISPRMIEEAQKKLSQAHLQADLSVGTVERLLFEDESFDVVITSSVLDHVPYLDPCFQEISRVLKAEGCYIYSGLHPDADIAIHSAGFWKGNQRHMIQEFHHGFEEIHHACKKHGLKPDRILEIPLDEKQKHIYSEKTYQQEKGKNIYTIIKCEKV